MRKSTVVAPAEANKSLQGLADSHVDEGASSVAGVGAFTWPGRDCGLREIGSAKSCRGVWICEWGKICFPAASELGSPATKRNWRCQPYSCQPCVERGSLGRLGPPGPPETWSTRNTASAMALYVLLRGASVSILIGFRTRVFSLVGYVASLVWGSWSRLAGHVASDLGCRRLLQMSIGCLRGHRGSSWASQKHPGGP